MRRFLILAGWLLSCLPAFAQDRLIQVPTRPDITVSYWYMPRAGATATIVLMTGGGGSIGYRNGQPTSGNFLVRSRDLFAARGFNVAIVGRPTDVEDMDGVFRSSPRHLEDLGKVVDDIRARGAGPLWMIGTSMGTVSAAAAAIGLGADKLAGVVLTSSITAYKLQGAVPRQNLEAIRIPTLVMHHARDGCWACAPHEVPLIVKGLTNAPVKKLLMVSGGDNPKGNPCEAFHWHGYIGMEAEAVALITDWIRNPQP